MFEGTPPFFADVAWRVGALLAGGGLGIVLLNLLRPRTAATTERQVRARASLWPRFWVWVIGTCMLLGSAATGGRGFGVLLALLSIQAVREVTGALRARGIAVPAIPVTIAAPAIVLWGITWNGTAIAIAATVGVWLAWLVVSIARGDTRGRLFGAGAGVVALGYVALPLAVLAEIISRPSGFALVSWLVIVAALSDTLAMFGGLAFGRRPVASTLSPGKTAEGVAAGVVGALAGAALMRFAFADASAFAYYGAAFGVAVAALAGDLLASSLKRAAGIKDFSRFLPGHGGLMDRFDSILLSVPALVLFERLGAFG